MAQTPVVDRETGQEDALRAAMVRTLQDEGAISSGAVAAAFRAVPRHLFALGETLEAAYAPHGTVTPKRDADGLLLSVISAPDIQARMLEPASIEPGMRVLEVGSGGYNAALISEIVGPAGQVITVDIDPDVRARARAGLDAAGYEGVRVVTADASSPQVLGLLDLSEPVALLLVALLHFFPDSDNPGALVAELRAALAPGSFVVISHGTTDGQAPHVAEAMGHYDQNTARFQPRSHTEVMTFFDGLELIAPGLVPVPLWRPGQPGDAGDHPRRIAAYGGVGRKR